MGIWSRLEIRKQTKTKKKRRFQPNRRWPAYQLSFLINLSFLSASNQLLHTHTRTYHIHACNNKPTDRSCVYLDQSIDRFNLIFKSPQRRFCKTQRKRVVVVVFRLNWSIDRFILYIYRKYKIPLNIKKKNEKKRKLLKFS